MLRKTLAGIAAGVLASAICASASASTVLDTGAPPANGGGYVLAGSSGVFGFQFLASQFHLGATTTIDSIEGFIGSGLGGTFHVGLATGANAPVGTVQQAGVYLSKQASSTASDGDWFGASGLNWTLDAGDYWAFFAVLDGNHPVNNEHITDTLDGFMTAPSPFPAVSDAFINNATGGAWSGAHLSLGVRINHEADGGVPEPATWVMMIGGFGLSGAMLRRRRTAAATA